MSTVLVVEDDLKQQQIIAKILATAGLDVIFACDGVEALEMVDSHEPKLVILDIVLPRMNGYEVCRRLKSRAEGKVPIVLIYSNKDEKCDLYWANKQGADAYISKFGGLQELIDTVERLLEEEAASSEL